MNAREIASQVGLRVEPSWWNFVRQLVIFVLGLSLIIYAVTSPGHDATFLLAGLILMGIIPVDRMVDIFDRRSRRDD